MQQWIDRTPPTVQRSQREKRALRFKQSGARPRGALRSFTLLPQLVNVQWEAEQRQLDGEAASAVGASGEVCQHAQRQPGNLVLAVLRRQDGGVAFCDGELNLVFIYVVGAQATIQKAKILGLR